MMKIKKSKTERGFGLYEFTDLYGSKCSIQDSSLATESAIWFGVDDPHPVIMSSKIGEGWIDYPIPPEVLLHTRMHLSQKQVQKLLPILQHFAETGEYVRDFRPRKKTKKKITKSI